MSWKGTWRKVQEDNERDMWAADGSGILISTTDDQTIELAIDPLLIEDDGEPFEEGEAVEILVRRVREDAE